MFQSEVKRQRAKPIFKRLAKKERQEQLNVTKNSPKQPFRFPHRDCVYIFLASLFLWWQGLSKFFLSRHSFCLICIVKWLIFYFRSKIHTTRLHVNKEKINNIANGWHCSRSLSLLRFILVCFFVFTKLSWCSFVSNYFWMMRQY